MATVVNTPTQQYQVCIDICNRCMQVCEECLTSCLNEPDAQARVHCINLLRDCAEICSFASRSMSRNRTYVKQICSLCADICMACATECAKFKDEHCQRCAEICRQCADECRKMAS
jgi:hypothetical protein